jgi:aldehyde dehydrogenase (NAD+)
MELQFEPASIIGGVRKLGTRRVSHINPATAKLTAELPCAGPAEVDSAIAAARAALPAWDALGVPGRRQALNKLADLIERDGEMFAQLGTTENGTPLLATRAMCSTVPADWFRYYAGFVDKIEGRTIPIYPENAFDYTIMRPHGVVALVYGFNGPMAFIGFKVAAALAAGNTVVLKPSELAPWTSVAFTELCSEAGIPDGVVNLLLGDGETGALLCAHKGVDKISFTGGSATATRLIATASQNLTPVSTELGGKSAALLFADSNLDVAVPTLVGSALSMVSGQVCLAGTRLLVERSIYGRVLEQAAAIAGAIKVGNPSEEDTAMGPLITAFHRDRVLGVIEKARAEGQGRLIAGGNSPKGALEVGAFVNPTIFADVDPASALGQEEIFGPVLSIIPFDTEDEAISVANNTRYGLAGYVYTRDISRAHRVTHRMEAGFLSINMYGLCKANVPFGGLKASGSGREGGVEGLHEMLVSQNIMMSLET